MARYLRMLVVVVVVAALVGGAYFYFIVRPVQAAAPNVATATAQIGNIEATVTSAGNITPLQAVNLDFGQSGTVLSVGVQVGDQVKAGQVLAQLDTSSLTLAEENAQANLQAAQDKLTQAKNPNTPQDIANSRAALDAAQSNYAKLTAPPKQTDVAAAQAAVASAQAAYDAALKSGGTQSQQLTAAAAAAQNAQASLQQAQAAYDRVASQPNVGATSQSVALQQATNNYQQALANYQALQATSASSSDSTIAGARSTLQQAVANLAKVETPNTPQDIQSAKDQVAQAQANLDKLLAGPDPAAVDVAQTAVDQAQVAVKQAKLALTEAQIVAPFDGVVTAVNITAGQATNINSGGGSGATVQAGVIQVADLQHLQLIVNMAETDIPNIAVGQPVQVTLDALPNLTLNGKVSRISPAGALTQGVVNYPVTIDLSNPPSSVKTQMTATANVITKQANNVLEVPNRAVRTQGQSKFVTVLFEGQQIQVPVTTGLSSDTMTQITSGLREGDQVVLNSTTTAQPRGGPGGPGGGAFFRGG
jgi:HlyD family secretion protein